MAKKKKKKYSTRYERNKRIYYNNQSKINDKNSNKNYSKVIFVILIISIFFNGFFLIKINNSNAYEVKAKEKNNELENKLDKLKDNYNNYLFLGDSITDFYDLDKYYENLPVVNSGISGNTTEDILNDMKNRVYDYNPSKIFLLIGTNDLIYDKSVDEIVDNIKKIIKDISDNRPNAKIYVESIYPVNKNLNEDAVNVRDNEDIKEINKKIKKYCKDNNYTYIDMYNTLSDEEDNFSEEYTDDGLHPNDRGYETITKELKKYLEV